LAKIRKKENKNNNLAKIVVFFSCLIKNSSNFVVWSTEKYSAVYGIGNWCRGFRLPTSFYILIVLFPFRISKLHQFFDLLKLITWQKCGITKKIVPLFKL
jgi:hypothetical protein